jgi:hypothetical protein
LFDMIKERTDFIIKLDYSCIHRHQNALVSLKEFSNIFIDHSFAVLRVIKMVLDQAVFTDEALVLATEF